MRFAILLAFSLLSSCTHAESGSEILVTKPKSDAGGEEFTVPLLEADFRAAFPMLSPNDAMLPICSNSMAGSSIRFRFARDQHDHKVKILSSDCRADERGLFCKPLSMAEHYYFNLPMAVSFDLGTNVTYEDAEALYEAFGEDGIPDVPEWYKGFKRDYITYIDRDGDAFRITVGDVMCTHCVANFVVQLKSDGDRNVLRLLKEPDGMCI